MNPFSIAFDLQRVLYSILAFIVWTLMAFGAGYAYHWHNASVDNAGAVATVETAATTTTAATDASDKQAVARLATALAASRQRAAALEQQIKDAQRENPPSPTCNLPVGLRDQINADLAPR